MNDTAIAAFASIAAMALAGSALATPSATDYVAKADAADLFELQSSKLVLGSTSNPKLRQFATQIAIDHRNSAAEVEAAAEKSGLAPRPPMLSKDQQAMMTALQSAQGSARDMLYLQQQGSADSRALALQQDYAIHGAKPLLKATAAEIVPVVEQHIAMLARIESRLAVARRDDARIGPERRSG
jgi:putative membrane protein